ncbi:MAG: hypothetical protein ACOYJL_10015 [Tractidigestivibacter sp.]|jgi:hypothetical protein|uniref:hypothetical protein n=1 Tax=Tractidigestivibacter sp. TaxID=2847320 RepID=UPI003D93F4A7
MAERELLVGFESALSFWRTVRAAGLGDNGTALATDGHVFGSQQLPVPERVGFALRCCNADRPLHIVVPSIGKRTSLVSAQEHVWSGVTKRGDLLGMGQGVSFYEMPATFVQLGMVMTDIELAQVANEMMGTYGLTPWADESRVQDIKPLVSYAELQEYALAAKAAGVRGATRACHALELATPGSNSPRETDVAVFMKLSRRKGGAELGGFVMNEPIHVPDEYKSLAGQSTISPDFCWTRQKVSQEYDSDEDHLTSRAKTTDERRRQTLEAMGYRVFVLTNGILRSNSAFNAYLRELEVALGLRRRALSSHALDLRRNLREQLFGPELASEALRELNGH